MKSKKNHDNCNCGQGGCNCTDGGCQGKCSCGQNEPNNTSGGGHLIAIPVPPMFPPSLLALGVEAIGPHRLREMMLELLDGTDIEPVGEMLVVDGSDGLEVALDELAEHLIDEIMSACGDDDDDGEEADTATGVSPEAPTKSLSRDSADAVLELLKDDCSAEQFAKIQAFLQGLAD